MRIGINTASLITGHRFRGIGWYTKRLVQALKKYEKDNEYILFNNEDMHLDVNVVHYPHFDPFFLTLPGNKIKPLVVTVHDLIPIIFPKGFPRGIRGEVKWQLQRRSLQRATCIITDSKISKEDISRLVPFPRERIFVVHLAAGDEFKLKEKDSELEKTAQKYRLDQNFFLYVGDLNYHKNIPVFLKGFRKLINKGESIQLVFVGRAFLDKNLKEARQVRELVRMLDLDASVNFLGFVETEELVNLYNLARALIVPSLYEGFGLPLVEAMSCGCPVIASDIPIHQEIGASSILYFDPKDPDSMSETLKDFLQKDERSILNKIKEGLKRAQFFSWRRVAQETAQVYSFAKKYGNHP